MLYLSDVMFGSQRCSFAGGFGDVYFGTHHGRAVAIKRPRHATAKHRREATKVRAFRQHECYILMLPSTLRDRRWSGAGYSTRTSSRSPAYIEKRTSLMSYAWSLLDCRTT
jgi:hypothetical protein